MSFYIAGTETITYLIPLSPFLSRFSAKVILLMRHAKVVLFHDAWHVCNTSLTFTYTFLTGSSVFVGVFSKLFGGVRIVVQTFGSRS